MVLVTGPTCRRPQRASPGLGRPSTTPRTSAPTPPRWGHGAAGDTFAPAAPPPGLHRNRIREDLGNPDLLLIEGPGPTPAHTSAASWTWPACDGIGTAQRAQRPGRRARVEVPPSALLRAVASGATRGRRRSPSPWSASTSWPGTAGCSTCRARAPAGHDIADAVVSGHARPGLPGCHYAPLDDDWRRALEEGITWPAGMETAGGSAHPARPDHPALCSDHHDHGKDWTP